MAVSARLLGAIAEATVRANSLYRQMACNEPEQPWETMDDDARQQIVVAVARALTEKQQSAEECHKHWLETHAALGWTRGEVEDKEKKISPYMVPWEELSPQAKAKSALFLSIVMPFYNY